MLVVHHRPGTAPTSWPKQPRQAAVAVRCGSVRATGPDVEGK